MLGTAAAAEASIAATCPPPTYQRRQPEGSVLYRTLEANLDRFLATTAGDEGPGLPAFVTRELRAYLRCGVLEQGCLHVRCERCADEMVGFSCKGRGFCPSCGGRRMSELAAQLVERVIPPVPVRQWVLSLPWTLRCQLAFDAGLCGAVLAVFIRVVFGCLAATAARQGLRPARCGAVTAIQRFGSALNLNLHFHALVLDGVYTQPTPEGAPVFHALPPPTDDEIGTILERVHARVQKLLRRCGRRLIPAPWFHLLRFHGLLAPHAAGRAQIIPRGGAGVDREGGPVGAGLGPGAGAGAPPAGGAAGLCWVPLLKGSSPWTCCAVQAAGAGGGSWGSTPAGRGRVSCWGAWGSASAPPGRPRGQPGEVTPSAKSLARASALVCPPPLLPA